MPLPLPTQTVEYNELHHDSFAVWKSATLTTNSLAYHLRTKRLSDTRRSDKRHPYP